MKNLYLGVKVIKAKDAEALLALNTFEGQRKISPIRVDMLKRKMTAGLFRNMEIAIGRLNDSRYLLNGQHQLTALLEVGGQQKAVVQELNCDNASDLAKLYTQFDIVPRRTEREIVQAFATGTGDDVPVDQLQIALRGITFLISSYGPGLDGLKNSVTLKDGGGRIAMLADERAELLNVFRGEASFVLDTCFPGDRSPAETRFIQRSGATGAMITTWRKHKADARAFWTSVRDGVGLERNSPAKRLRDFLLGERAKQAGGSAANFYTKSVVAWNAYREGRDVVILKNWGGKAPEVR